MLSEVNNELFTLCEDAVNEILEPFFDEMRLGGDETEIIKKKVAGLSLTQRFTISCFIMEMSEHVDLEENSLPDDEEQIEWLRLQWQCALEDEKEL